MILIEKKKLKKDYSDRIVKKKNSDDRQESYTDKAQKRYRIKEETGKCVR